MVGKNKVSSRREEIFILIVRLEKISEKVAAELVKEMNFIDVCVFESNKEGGAVEGVPDHYRDRDCKHRGHRVGLVSHLGPPRRSGPHISKQGNYSVSTVEQCPLQLF